MIPTTKPVLGEKEAAAAQEVILFGWVTQGPKVKAFEEAFAQVEIQSSKCSPWAGSSNLACASNGDSL